jgi:hypothetical protein
MKYLKQNSTCQLKGAHVSVWRHPDPKTTLLKCIRSVTKNSDAVKHHADSKAALKKREVLLGKNRMALIESERKNRGEFARMKEMIKD